MIQQPDPQRLLLEQYQGHEASPKNLWQIVECEDRDQHYTNVSESDLIILQLNLIHKDLMSRSPSSVG